jgi:SAM-dependent methyltransferase
VSRTPPRPGISSVQDDARDYYGKDYWFSHQEVDFAQPGILPRVRTDLPERCVHWLRTLLKYKQPPGRVLELGSAHGGFVALSRWAGFDAAGLELSPWVVAFARETFDVPMYEGPLEQQPIEPASLDAIALMDVLEHLPDPVGTMQRAVGLLKPDGLLVIQTPRYVPGSTYQALQQRQDPFLAQLKTQEHLFLFSGASVEQLLSRAGAPYVRFEQAVFAQYDMWLVAGGGPLPAASDETVFGALSRTPGGRLVGALLDAADQRDEAQRQGAGLLRLEADVAHLKAQLAASEADRAARLNVIERQGSELGTLQARLEELEAQRTALDHQLREAGGLVEDARHGKVLRVARAVRPQGADAALARAAAILKEAQARLAAAGLGAPGGTPVDEPAPIAHQSAQIDPLCARIRDPKTTEPFHYSPAIVTAICGDLSAHGFVVEEVTLDPAEYRAYFDAAGYAERYPDYYSFNLPEKSLEHFFAAKLLELGPGDVYIDIASEHSPVPEIYSRLFGCASFRQDLAYPEGLNGDRIGGDAAAMPVPEGFASKMALHCSFEHFEGNADERFIREVERVLRPGGRVCFAPLYLWERFGVLTDPAVAIAQAVHFDVGATVYCKPGWGNRHGRLYDPAQLAARVRANLGSLQLTLYHIVNAAEVDPSCYLQFAAVISKPA